MATRNFSRQREAIKSFLDGRTDHPTADVIYSSLRESYPNLSLGTVYRNLSVLEKDGRLRRIQPGDECDHYDGNTVPHSHFVCSSCHRVYDIFQDSDWQFTEELLEKAPGRILSCDVIYHGICRECDK